MVLHPRARGFTLIEVLIVLGIFGIIGLISAQLVNRVLGVFGSSSRMIRRICSIPPSRSAVLSKGNFPVNNS